MTSNLRQKTFSALIWSFAQNWGSKFFSLFLFFVLARILSPAEIGIASTVALVLMFIAVLSEQGMIEAIVQQQGLKAIHLNLPFLVSMTIALLCSIFLLVFGHDIAKTLGVSAAGNLIMLAAVVPPISAATNFQTAVRRKKLDFRSLAVATLWATLLSGSAAVALALAGFGALSLVVQVILLAFFLAVVLWWRPLWRPTFEFDLTGFKKLLAFSSSAFVSKLIDFFSSRVIDFAMLSKFGVAGLGMYTVGSKLYLTIFQLFASTLMDVALSAFSKLIGQDNRLGQTYQRFMFVASCTTLPLFILVAAVAPEICTILFGNQWTGVASILQWLCLLGAAQVVSCFNASLLAANGKSRQLLAINVAKFVMGISAITLLTSASMESVTFAFVCSQLAVIPVVFLMASMAGKIEAATTLRSLLPGVLCTVIAYLAVNSVRSIFDLSDQGQIVRGLLLSAVFCSVFIIGIVLIAFKRVRSELDYLRSSSR